MKRKALAIALCAVMASGIFAGCSAEKEAAAASGKSKTAEAAVKEAVAEAAVEAAAEEAAAEAAVEAAAEEAAAETAPEEGSDYASVLNICCRNDEFQIRMQDHYPGYETIDSNTGMIGDVLVKWSITPDDKVYQNKLDKELTAQIEGRNSGDELIDIFIVEADYARKYTESDMTMSLKELGITDEDLADQFRYTKDAMTDSKGVLRGVSWQACPGLLIYNRALAKEVIGSDDPAEVQKAVADWEAFRKTAGKAAEKGYYMTSSADDLYCVFSSNVTSKWVDDKNKINVDKNIEEWAKLSKSMADAKQTRTFTMWSDEWSEGFFKQESAPKGNVFCYFGPKWFIDSCMSAGEEGAIASNGGWGACKGPQSFFRGGTWICAAAGTDDPDLVKDIMLTMTTDKEVLNEIVAVDDEFINSKTVMEELANNTEYKIEALGGQNAIQMFLDGIESIDLKNTTIYDQICNEEFRSSMKKYFDGQCSYEEALKLFDKAVHEKYPDLK